MQLVGIQIYNLGIARIKKYKEKVYIILYYTIVIAQRDGFCQKKKKNSWYKLQDVKRQYR